MLYLFGRLALSDSYYFNQDTHADEQPEALAAARPTRPAAAGPAPRLSSAQPLASPAAADGAARKQSQ